MEQKETRPVGQITCEIGRLLVAAGQRLIRYSPTPEAVQSSFDELLAAAEKFGDLPESLLPEADVEFDELRLPDIEGK